MFEFQQIAFYIICIAGLWFLGVPFGALLSRKHEHEKDIVPFTFLIGAAVIMLLSWWLSFLNLPMKYAAYVIVFLGIAIWLIALRQKAIHLTIFLTRQNLSLLLICFFAGFLALIPMVFFKACFPYGDGYTYLCISDFLVDHGYSTNVELDPYHPWLTQIYLYQTRGLRIGAQLFLSFWTSLFRQGYSILTYTPVSAVGVFLFGISVWFFACAKEETTPKDIVYTVIFSAFNVPIVLWSVIFGFYPQLFGLTFMIAALREILPLLKSNAIVKLPNTLEGGIIISVMALCYSEIVPFFALSIAVVFVFESCKHKMWKRPLISLLLVACTSIICMGKYFGDMISAIFSQFGAVVGDEKTINWLGYIGYWLSSVPADFNYKVTAYSLSTRLVFIFLTLALLTLLLVGIVKCKKKEKWEILKEGFMLSIPYFLLLVYFSCISHNPFSGGIGNSWSIYKLAQYYFIILCIYLFPFFSNVFHGIKKRQKLLGILFPIFFCIIAIINCAHYSYSITREMYKYVGSSSNPVNEYLKIADLYKNEDQTINLVSMPDAPRKLLTYFLKDNRLSSDWNTDSYFSIYGQTANPAYDINGITLKYSPQDKASIAGVIPIDASYVDVQSGEGVGSVEASENMGSWTWNNVLSNYTILNYTDQKNVAVSFLLSCADNSKDNYVDIYVEDQLVLSQSVNATEKNPVTIYMDIEPGGQAVMQVIYHGNTLQENGNSGRELAVCVWALTAYTVENP